MDGANWNKLCSRQALSKPIQHFQSRRIASPHNLGLTMGKSLAFSNALLALIFNGTPIPNIADNAASGPLVNLYVALHTADPGAGGNQQTSEAAYTGYARQPVARSNLGFTVSTNFATLNNNVIFPAPTGNNETITHFSIGTSVSGAGEILYSGQLANPINTVTGIAPILNASTPTNVEET